MAELCKKCQSLQLPTNVAGSCRRCSAHTEYFAYKLCADCAEALTQCERCEAPINAASNSTPSVGPTAYRVTLQDKDDGSVQKGMHPGEQLVVTLPEDQYSNTEWGVKDRWSYQIVKLNANNGFVPDPGQYQLGTRELVFDISGIGTEVLILEEKVRQYGWYGRTPTPSTTPAPNGKTWKVTVESN